MTMRHLLVVVLGVVVTGCTCGQHDALTPEGAGSGKRTLQPLPVPPPLNVAPEALPGTGHDLSVVVARPLGPTQAEVRPTITFSRPVKSLEMVEATRASDAPLGKGNDAAKPFATITPALEGEWRWLGSASVEFVPKGLVAYSTTYTVLVHKGLAALDGATLTDDYTWQFSTPALELQSVLPARNDRWVTPEATFELLWNQPVTAAELEKALDFRVNGTRAAMTVAKTVSIEDERRAKQAAPTHETMSDEQRGYRNQQTRITLKPTQPLPVDAALTLAFDPALHGAQGPLSLTTPAAMAWHTYGPMTLGSARFCVNDNRCSWGPLVITATNGIDVASLKERVKVTPAVDLDWDTAELSVPDQYSPTDEPRVSVSGNFKPGTRYQVEIAAGVKDVFKQAATAGLSATITTADLQPRLNTGAFLGVIEATDAAPKLPIEVANLKTLTVQLWKLSLPELAQVLSKPEYQSKALITRQADFSEVQQLAYPRNESRVHALELSKVLGKDATRGFTLVNVNSPDLEYKSEGSRQVVQVTDLAAHIKIAPRSSLVWVTRMSTGAPVADCDVSVLDENGASLWAGKTTAEGFADVPGAVALKLRNVKNSWEYPFALVVAQKDGDASATANSWADGVEPYEFSLSQGWEAEQPQSASFAFTDRGIYRPGDEVFIKGVVRYRVLGALQSAAAGSLMDLVVSDSHGDAISTQKVKVTAFGTFTAKATIPKDAPTGSFTLAATGVLPNGKVSVSGDFRVEEYRAPQFRVDLEGKKTTLVAGEPLEGDVFARYLFGGAMNDAKVSWSVNRTSFSFSTESAPGFTFSQETWWWDDNAPHEASAFFGSGSGRADATGAVHVKAGTTEAPGEKPYTYTLEAEVTDVNRQSVAGRLAYTVHPSNAYVGLRAPSSFMQVGTEYGLETVTVDPAGKRAPGKKVQVTVTARTWKSVKKKDASGGFTTVSEPDEQQVASCELTSTTDVVPCKFKPAAAGFFIVRATVKDEQGRTHSSSLGVYATGADWVAWQRADTDRIELLTDKTSYDVGDVAKVLIKSPYPEARAMVTVEREGVLSRRLVELKGSVVTVDVPITEDMVPNVFAGVLIMRPRLAKGGLESGDDPGRPNARIGLVKINVEKKSKRLAVTVTTDKKDYRPRDTVNVTLEVKDAAGKPASGEVTLYAVDESVLRLTGYTVPDPIESIFPDRPLSVRLGEPLLHLVRMRSYGEKGEGPGGGGGGANAEGVSIRSNFKTTAYFNPTVTLEDGKAKASFPLPDNLTTYRIMAVVVGATDRFGSGETKVQVNKPVMALPALPRFARVDDVFEAGVVVHAHGATAGEATVTAKVEGGAQLTGPAEQKIAIAEGAPKEVRFGFKGTLPGTAKFTFKVVSGADNDGVQETLPIEMPVEIDSVATYGDTTDQRVEGLVPPKDVWPELGGLTVTMSSTAMSGFDRGFQQLIDYPYGCLEQQSSRLVPFIALREMAGQFGIPWPGPNQKKLDRDSEFNALLRTYLFSTLDVADQRDPDDVIATTVKSILALQADDGSFRYWPDSTCSDSWSSAYATMALFRAKEVGFEVPARQLDRAEQNLARVAGGTCHPCERYCGDETRVFASYVLARMKKPRPSAYPEFFANRAKLSLFGRALLANAMYVGKGDRTQANTLLKELLNDAKESAKGVHFEEVNSATYATLFNSDTRTTGVVLQALTDISPDHPYVGKMTKYLTQVREGNGEWRSTQEAAWSLLGLTEVLRTKEKVPPDFKASLTMGTASLMAQDFKGRSLSAQKKTVPMKDLLAQASGADQKLTFKKDGAGVLYYSALMRYAPRTLPTKSLDNGLFVQRWFEPYEGGGQTLAFTAGELVRVRLRVASNQQRYWTAFEVPLPAGLEPVDTSLASTAKLKTAPDDEGPGPVGDEENAGDGESGSADPDASNPWATAFWSPFNHLEIRDSKVIAFADELPPGVHVVSFVARATTPGTFVLKPAKGTLMYEPEVWGRSEGGSVTVTLPTPVSVK
jgi:hypothetical protein